MLYHILYYINMYVYLSFSLSISCDGAALRFSGHQISLSKGWYQNMCFVCVFFSNVLLSSLNQTCLCIPSCCADIFQKWPFSKTPNFTKPLFWNVVTSRKCWKVIDFIIVFSCLQFKSVQRSWETTVKIKTHLKSLANPVPFKMVLGKPPGELLQARRIRSNPGSLFR